MDTKDVIIRVYVAGEDGKPLNNGVSGKPPIKHPCVTPLYRNNSIHQFQGAIVLTVTVEPPGTDACGI